MTLDTSGLKKKSFQYSKEAIIVFLLHYFIHVTKKHLFLEKWKS